MWRKSSRSGTARYSSCVQVALVDRRQVDRLRGSGGSAAGSPLVVESGSLTQNTTRPGQVVPGPDRRNRFVDEHLVVEVNNRLAAFGPSWTGGRVDAAWIRAALAALPRGGPSDPFGGLATDIAVQIARGQVVRVRAGGVGVEAEARNVVELPVGVDKRRFRIDAQDGSISVVLDSRQYYQATDGTVYRPLAALERAGKTLDHAFQEHVLEITTAPTKVLPGDVGRKDGDYILAMIKEVVGRLRRVRGRQRLQTIFPEGSFVYSDVARDAVVKPDPAGLAFDLHLHFTAGVPITRMHEFLSEARDHTTPGHPARDHLADGLNFGNEIAAGYVSTPADHAGHRIPPYAVHLLAERADVSALRGFLSLVYAQVAPIVHGKPGPHTAMKTRAAAASRTSLAGIRATLPEPVRAFLQNQAAAIRQTLVQRLQHRIPEVRATDPLSLQGLNDSERTIGEYLDTALLPGGWPPPINQYEALGVDTHFDEPDTNEGQLGLPLVLVELRRLGDRPYPRQTVEGVGRQYEMVASMAQRAYVEARAVAIVSRTMASRRVAAATVADLAMFGDTSTDWLRGIESVLATAWRLDPVLRGVAGADAVITQDQVEQIVRTTSAVLRGDHSHVEALADDLSVIRAGLRELVATDAGTEGEVNPALETAENVIAHLRGVESSTRSEPLAEPGRALPERHPQDRFADDSLVAEVNSRLDAFGPNWAGGRVDAARIQDALAALPVGGPSDVFELATDIAFQIVGSRPPSVRTIGSEPATGFELGGLEHVADEYSELITTPAYSLVVERMKVMEGPNAGRVLPVIEIVLKPANALDGETGRQSGEEAFGSLSFVLDRLRNARQGSTVAEVFRGVPDTVPRPYAQQATLLGDPDPGRISTHFNVGVPMSGVRELLRAVAQGNGFRPDWVAHRHAESALVFGDEVAARAEMRPEDRLRRRYVARVRNYATLVYTQVAAMLHGLLSDGGLMKHNTLIASRTPLADLRRSLPSPVREFLREEAAWIRGLFQDLYRAHNGTMLSHNRRVPASGELLAVEWSHWNVVTSTREPAHTIGQYLDNALVGITDPAQVVDQWISLGIPTMPPEMDGNFGQRRSNPLVVLEVQSFDASEHEFMRELSVDDDRLERVARHTDNESSILQQLERRAGLEVMFAKEDHLKPRWGWPGAAEQFGEFVARAAEGRRAAERGTLFVNVQGGGNGGLRSNAHTTGLDRADAVIQALKQRIGPELRDWGLPEDAVGFIRSSRGSRDSSDYPFEQAEGTTEERRRRVHVWIDSSGRRARATEQAQPEASTSYEGTNAPRLSPAWTNALTAHVNSAPMKTPRPHATVAEQQRVLMAYAYLPEWLARDSLPVVARRIAELILTGQVTLRRGDGWSSAPADPATPGPGGVRPMEGAEPPAGKGKAKDAWHTLERPMTKGSGTHDRYEVSDAGRIRLSDGQELSPGSWVRYGNDFVHRATGMSLRGKDGRIEPIDEWELRGPLDGDSLAPHILWADRSYVYLMPESGGPVMGLPLVVDEPGPDVRDPSPVLSAVFDLAEVPDDMLLSQAYLYEDGNGGYGVGRSGLGDETWREVGALAEYGPILWLTGLGHTDEPEPEVTVAQVVGSDLRRAVEFLTMDRGLSEARRVARYLDEHTPRLVWRLEELPDELDEGTWIWLSGGGFARIAAVVLPDGSFHIYVPGVHSTEVRPELRVPARTGEAPYTFVIAMPENAGAPTFPPGLGATTGHDDGTHALVVASPTPANTGERPGTSPNEPTPFTGPGPSSSPGAPGRPAERSRREDQGHPGGARRFGREIGRFVTLRWVSLPSFVRVPGERAGRPGATGASDQPATGAGGEASREGRSAWRNVQLAGVFSSVFRAAGDSRQGVLTRPPPSTAAGIRGRNG
jgi:hypothetical protein